MSLAEELYETSTTRSETPPVWVDVSFILIITIIHIIYASKFTMFSFGYLKAKCEEKTERRKWPESKLYLHAIVSNPTGQYLNLSSKSVLPFADENTEIFSKLWVQLYLLRSILKILLFLCSCIILVLYLSFVLNILYEYFVVCIINWKHASFLALIILPFIWFINASAIRFLVYGIMACWSINVDNIADTIAYQQHHEKMKEYAYEKDAQISEEQRFSDAEKSENSIEREARGNMFKHTLKGVMSDYFMAVHWRLWIIFLSLIATILALPSFGNIETEPGADQNWQLTDGFWLQLFLRYILLAMTSWLCVYFLLSCAAAIYGRVSTLPVYNQILDATAPEAMDEKSTRKNSCLRMFCLMDPFGIQDRYQSWVNYKIVLYSLFVVSGIICIIVGSALGNGLIRFVGIINIVYYLAQLLVNCKVRGMHYLWRADMVSLEMKHWWHDSDEAHEHQSHKSHCSGMAQLNSEQLKTILSDHNIMFADSESENEQELQDVIPENEEKMSVMERGTANTAVSESRIISLFISTHQNIFHARRAIYREKHDLVWYKNFCEIQKINFKLFVNHFRTIFKLYKTYWFLILPYHMEIRPLSVGSSGKSLSERLVYYKWKQLTFFQMFKQCIVFFWHGLRGLIACGLFLGLLTAVLYLSVGINQITVDSTESVILTNNVSNRTSELYSGLFDTLDDYGLCQTKWDANLSVFDLASLAHVAYEIEDDPNDQIMSMQQLICLYFDRIKPTDTSNKTCSWQIIHISRSQPAYFHMRHSKNKTEVIAIRGTWTAEEMSQDIALFNEVAILQTASWLIPITTILPQSFIIQIVYFASWFEGTIDNEVRARFDEPLFEYSYNYLSATKNEIESFYYIGHSLGGGIAQIVAAQLYRAHEFHRIINNNSQTLLSHLDIKSFSLAAPGLVWNSRKFSVDVVDLYETATLVKPRHDIVSKIDQYGGLTQNIECIKSKVLDCHLTVNTICQLSNVCNVYNSHNPDLIQAFCEGKNGELYMGYANYSS